MKIISITSSIIRNLTKDHLLDSFNALRLLGILTRKTAFIGPLKIVMDITNRCDMRCAMCWYHSSYLENGAQPIREMPLEKFKLLVQEFKRLGIKSLMLTGEGEPFTHPDIEEMIDITKDNFLEVEVMTNAYYLNSERIKLLIKSKVKKIIVSLHCGDAKTFCKVRPLKNESDFYYIVENLSQLKNLGNKSPLLYIINVISKPNYNNVGEMIELAKILKADKILFKPLSLSRQLSCGDLMLSAQEEEKVILDLRLISPKLDIPNNISDYIKTLIHNRKAAENDFCNSRMDSRYQLSKICYIPWVQTVIGLDGEVLGCAYSDRCPLGNIYKISFGEIWRGQKYKTFREGIFCPQRCLGRAVYPFLF